MALIASLAWGLIVLFSFAGLGRSLVRIIAPRLLEDRFLAAGWGMAGMVVLGGPLNLIGLARAELIIALVFGVIVIDVLLERYARRANRDLPGPGATPAPPRRRQQIGREDMMWITALVLLIAARYISSYGIHGNFGDDRPAYLFQAARMLQTGSIGLNPFSERQLMSPNGQTFLLALFLCGAPAKYAYLFDPGICWILIAGVAWEIIRRDHQGSVKAVCLLTGMVLMVDEPPILNLAGHLTGTVLYLALVRTAYLISRNAINPDWGSLTLLAMTAAGLSGMKTTFLVLAVLFVIFWSALRMLHSPSSRTVRELVIVGIITAALLMPWMWQQYLSGGTLLYPFLGQGNHLSIPGLNIFGDSLGIKLKTIVISWSVRSLI